MEEFKLTDEIMKQVSGGFRPGDLTEEEQKRYDEMNRRAYGLYHGLPETQAEFDIAFKEMEEYHVELTSRVWERRHSSNQ